MNRTFKSTAYETEMEIDPPYIEIGGATGIRTQTILIKSQLYGPSNTLAPLKLLQ